MQKRIGTLLFLLPAEDLSLPAVVSFRQRDPCFSRRTICDNKTQETHRSILAMPPCAPITGHRLYRSERCGHRWKGRKVTMHLNVWMNREAHRYALLWAKEHLPRETYQTIQRSYDATRKRMDYPLKSWRSMTAFRSMSMKRRMWSGQSRWKKAHPCVRSRSAQA